MGNTAPNYEIYKKMMKRRLEDTLPEDLYSFDRLDDETREIIPGTHESTISMDFHTETNGLDFRFQVRPKPHAAAIKDASNG